MINGGGGGVGYASFVTCHIIAGHLILCDGAISHN